MATERNTREGGAPRFSRQAFENNHSKNRFPNRSGGKKPLPEPTHVGHFVVMVIMKFCRLILCIDTSVKIGVYLIGVMIGSVISDLFIVPRSVFSNKRNLLNMFFVKWGWGWTSTILLGFIFLTSYVYTCGKWGQVKRHLFRIGVGTFWWYVCTNSFVYVEHAVGACTNAAIGDKLGCVKAGKDWLGFDISGHVFLLTHCLIIISEETKCFKEWRKLGELLNDEELKDKRNVTEKEISRAKASYKSLTSLIKITVILLAALVMLWEFMLLISTIYRFHTLPQKITAVFVAVICWFISYRVIFPSRIPWLPCQPGESPLMFMKVT